jgi:hypothetical protein
MKFRLFLLLIVLSLSFGSAFAQMQSRIEGFGDGEAAQKYVDWIEKAIIEERWSEAHAAAERAKDFANVSSDISYLLACIRNHEGRDRTSIVEALDTALETNRWVNYNKNDALIFKASELISMRKYRDALACLEDNQTSLAASDLRLCAYRGMANSGDVYALGRFRSNLLQTMDRYPRNPSPLRIFLVYARGKRPEYPYDTDLLEFVLRRLPFVVEFDPELAWLAASFIRDTEEAKRYVMAYRAGAYSGIQSGDFKPHPGSIPIALNFGLLADRDAVEELFSGTRGPNNPLQAGLPADGNPVLDRRLLAEVFDLLRSDDGRDYFTEKLLSFTGLIFTDGDSDGIIESYANYESGVIKDFAYDRNQDNSFDSRILFNNDGYPDIAGIPVIGQGRASVARVQWERYPYVKYITSEDGAFSFAPGSYAYAAVDLVVLGGSKNYAGLPYPVPLDLYFDLTVRSLVSFASSITRSSAEFEEGTEQIFLDRGIPRQAVEILDRKQVSVTYFRNGLPFEQYLDMDADGRMETKRTFRRPEPGAATELYYEIINYQSLIESSESDWTGDGVYKTGEVYLKDGSVVYSWDMDGSGFMNYSETNTEQ